MQKLRFFLLWFLFFFTPIIYAWLYIPGIPGNLSDVVHMIFPDIRFAGFESVKVSFFLLIIMFVTLVTFWHGLIGNTFNGFSQSFIIALAIFFGWTLISMMVNADNVYFSMGNYEKTHGWFFYMGLFALFFVLQNLPKEQKSRLFMASIWGFGGVILYAIFQYVGWDPLKSQYATRLDMNRMFSTTGNPNYLAGLALMMLPLLEEQSTKYKVQSTKFLMFLSLGLIVYWTGSIFAYGTFAAYLIFQLMQYIFIQKTKNKVQNGNTNYQLLITNYALLGTIIITLLMLLAIYVYYGNSLFEMQKLKGFMARGFLWLTGLRAIIADPWHFLFGYGPDGFLGVSEQFRDWHLSNGFEDPAYRIDRAHNVFLDFIIHFGVPMFFALMWFAVRGFQKLSSYKQVSVVLFSIYFFFNIPVLVHYLLLVQIFTSKNQKDDQRLHQS